MSGGAGILLRGTTPGPELFARALHSAYALEWPIIDPDFSQESDVQVWEKLHRDGKIVQAINQRTATIASKNWIVEPKGETEKEILLATIIGELLENLQNFHGARRFLAQAVFRARSYLFIEGERQRVQIAGLPVLDWWFPRKLRHMDKRVVRFVPERRRDSSAKKETVVLRKEVFRPSDGVWVQLDDRIQNLLLEIIYDDEQGRLGYGRGLLEALYFLWWAKQVVLKEGLQAVERWAQGFLVGKVDTTNPGSTTSDTLTIRNTFRNELAAHRSRNVAVVDKNDDIELVTGGGEGWQIVKSMLDYLDNAILSTSLGSVLPFGGGLDKGSMARAEVEEDISDELLEFDRGIVDDTLTNGLIPVILENNRQLCSQLGLLDVRPPRFKTSNEKKKDPEKEARVIAVALGAGIPLKREEVYKRLDFSQPGEGDDVFEQTVQTAGPFGDPNLPSGFAMPGVRMPGAPAVN